ncbi:MAG: redox-sensitive transcriptional activator SoxR [bacterium]
MTVGQVAARCGVAVSTLHFYERSGLLTARRSSGNQRRYPREVVRRVSVIRAAQRLGVPLARIRAALDELPDGRTPTRADWARLSASWRAELDQRIADLERLRDGLSGCIGCGCLSLKNCALVNPDDALSTEGAGPRRLLS